MKIRMVFALTLCGSLAAGCGSEGRNENLMAVEQALDAAGTARIESALVAIALDGVTLTMTSEEAATHAADAAGFAFDMPACVTTDTQGSTVSYTFENCTGHYGLVGLDGTLEITFTIRPESVVLAMTGEFTANRTEITLDADIELLAAGPTERFTVETRSSALGPFGHGVEQSGSYTADFNEATDCITLHGNWTVTIGLRDWSLQIASFEQCGDACPSPGGNIVFEAGFRDWTVTISFDGTDKATWTAGDKSGTVFLPC